MTDPNEPTVTYWQTRSEMFYIFVEEDDLPTALRTMADALTATGNDEYVIDLGIQVNENDWAYTVGALVEKSKVQ